MDPLASINNLPLIGILRGFHPEQLPPILQAVTDGGLRNVEITMNSPSAAAQIQLARSGSSLVVGAGTVTSHELLVHAVDAGAQFIVTPNLNREIVSACVQRRVPILPGVCSPTEACEAWELGATMVKLFPADTYGPAFVRALRGPFPDLKLLPTGGINLETGRNFLKAGAFGLGVGSPLFDAKRIDAKEWNWLRSQARAFVDLFAD